MVSARTMLQRALYAAVHVQAAFRGAAGRRVALQLRRQRDATRIQAYARGIKVARQYRATRRSALAVQGFWRVSAAKA